MMPLYLFFLFSFWCFTCQATICKSSHSLTWEMATALFVVTPVYPEQQLRKENVLPFIMKSIFTVVFQNSVLSTTLITPLVLPNTRLTNHSADSYTMWWPIKITFLKNIQPSTLLIAQCSQGNNVQTVTKNMVNTL